MLQSVPEDGEFGRDSLPPTNLSQGNACQNRLICPLPYTKLQTYQRVTINKINQHGNCLAPGGVHEWQKRAASESSGSGMNRH